MKKKPGFNFTQWEWSSTDFLFRAAFVWPNTNIRNSILDDSISSQIITQIKYVLRISSVLSSKRRSRADNERKSVELR